MLKTSYDQVIEALKILTQEALHHLIVLTQQQDIQQVHTTISSPYMYNWFGLEVNASNDLQHVTISRCSSTSRSSITHHEDRISVLGSDKERRRFNMRWITLLLYLWLYGKLLGISDAQKYNNQLSISSGLLLTVDEKIRFDHCWMPLRPYSGNLPWSNRSFGP